MVHRHHHRDVHAGVIHAGHRLRPGPVPCRVLGSLQVSRVGFGRIEPANLARPALAHPPCDVLRIPVRLDQVHMAVDDEGHRRASLSAKSEMENIASDILEQRVPTLPLVSWGGEVAQPSTPEPLGQELARRGQQIAVSTLRHGFVRQLADGSLPQETFLRYLVQNALFLTGYAAALREAREGGVPSSVAGLLTGLETAISGPAIDRHVAEYRSRAGRDPDLPGGCPVAGHHGLRRPSARLCRVRGSGHLGGHSPW